MDRHSGGGPPPHLRGRPVSGKDAANANEYFEPFLNATTLKNILGYHRSMCEFLHLKPNVFTHFYPKLKANLTSWRAKALWKKFDLRASHKCYAKGKACSGTKVLVIGAGPCGLRTAIEAQLLGAKVVVVEKRDRLSRNNVLHLWPFVIEDLRMLGAKKFFGKFCAGAIDHISIRQLQCILLKVALLLGVEVHTEVSFVNLIEPNASNKTGWKADIKPDNHPVSQYEFDVIIGADGKRNTLQGFKRKEFRGKLAIAITANFINKKTEAEARVEEISGVAFIFNQKFFKDLQEGTRIDLENIVYYKDDTHYFVMTAKKASLLEKGVIKQDLADTEKLLAPDNVNREKLHQYAREAADFSTNYQMPDLEFAVNHYGLPDVAMFDFTSMYAAEYASKVVERNGHRLLMILVGDSLLEPFWPTGSGCARGFLSSLDAAWAIRSYSTGLMTPLDVLAERESIYRLLAQTTPDNLNKDWKAYTLDPATRYPNLNKTVVLPHQTVCLYDTDNPESVEKMKRASLDANTKHDHVSKKRRRGGVDNEVLLSWLSHQLRDHDDITITDIPSVFQGGKALSAIIHHYRPDLLDYSAIKDNEPGQCNQHAMDILEKDLGIPPFMTGEEITNTQDYLAMTTYLTQVYDTFRGEIPHIKHPKLKIKPLSTKPTNQSSIPTLQKTSAHLSHDDLTTSKEILKKRSVKREISRLAKSTSEKSILDDKESRKKGHLTSPQIDLTYADLDHCTKKKKHLQLLENGSQKNVKRIESRNVAVSVNLMPKRKIKLKKTKLSIIPESTDEKLSEQQDKLEHKSSKEDKPMKRYRPLLQSQTFFVASIENSPHQLQRHHLRSKAKMKTLKSSLGLKYFNPLQIIRRHLSTKKAQIKSLLAKPCQSNSKIVENVPKIQSVKSEVVDLKDEVNLCPSTSGKSIKIQIIQRTSKDKITLQNVEFKSSLNLVKITSRSCVSKRFSGRRFEKLPQLVENEENLKVEQIFLNKDIHSASNYSSKIESTSNSLHFNGARVNLGSCNLRKFRETPEKIPVPLTCADLQIIDALGVKSTPFKRKCHGKCNDSTRRQKFRPQNAIFYGAKRRDKLSMAYLDDCDSISPQSFSRVQNWISQHDFKDEVKKDPDDDTLFTCEIVSDMTSVTQARARAKGDYDDVKVEARTDEVKCESPVTSAEDLAELMRNLKQDKSINSSRPATKFTQYNSKAASLPPIAFPAIIEARESGELPPDTNKRSEFSIKSIKTAHQQQTAMNNAQLSRPSSRHKRHADLTLQKPSSAERKQRKRRTLERIGPSVEDRQKVLEEIVANRQDRMNKRKQHRQRQTEQFIKSMQMLHANAKPDKSEPFEDYSIFLYRQTAPKFKDRVKDLEKQFTYVPDYDNRATGMKPLANTNADEDIASKIRSLEDKWSNPQPVEKKPKDLLRAIGKIETSDWNIKQIEKKILENKLGKPSTTVDKERVPRWSREEFVARQTKMENKRLERQDSSEAKYADIDKNIKQLELKLKEGTTRELGQNKVASITEKLVSKVPQEIEKPVEKVQAKPVNLPIKSGSEFCHFCNKKVYLVEKICAEGRFFHNGCFKCQYCHIQLRLGSYMFDRDGQFGHRFFCSQHYGMPGELPRPAKVSRKPSHRGARDISRSPSKRLMSGVAGVDLLDKVRTPERIEFSNISRDVSSEDEPLSQMDEDEWTDKNFGASCNELDESDGDSSSSLGTDSDDEDAYDDALEQPVTKEGTLKLAERWKKIYSKGKHSDLDAYSSSDDNSYYENSSDDSDSDTATEGEEEIRARELRKQEVRVEPPVVQTDTGTDTEVKTNLDYLPPDILSDHPSSFASLHKSPSNYSISSEVFKSAESDVDYNMNKTYVDPSVVVGKLTISKPPVDSSTKKSNPLARSATASSLTSSKPKRNFVLPPKEQRKSIGEVFQEKVKLDEPLLVIRRTPSKVTLPKEIKPKVAVNAKGLDTSKYFGLPKIPQKSKIKRGDTAVTRSRPPLIKQASLPETANEKNEATFNFDLKESDLDHVDDYIEDLLSKKDELEKPVDYSKYATQNHEDISPENEKEELSSSIEDLFKALEEVTDVPHREMQKESDEKIDDLLKFMEELDHQTPERKVYRSVSDVKYRNLERLLKSPQRSESVVSKLPRNNLSFFETILKGKETPRDSSSDENLAEPRTRGLCRSKTEIHFNRGNKKQRTSVDVDAVGKVDIKSVLKKFESFEQEDELKAPKPEKKIIKRMSLGNFRDLGTEGAKISKLPAILKPKPIGNTIQKFESEPKKFKKVEYKKREPRRVLTTKYDEKSYEDTIKDLEKFVDEAIGDIGASKKLPEVKSNELGKSKSDWCVNITVSSKVNPEFLKLQEKRAENPLTGVNNEQQTNLYDNVGSNVNSDILRLHDEKLDENSSKDQNIKQKNSILKDKSDEFNQDLDFSQEMKDFNEAMSALTEESTLDSTSEPHNFSKAVDSSDSSETENIEPVIGKITDNIPQVIITNGVPADIDDLYAKVNKCKPPLEPPPPVPHRRKHSHGELPGAPLPPPRAARQKSLEAKTSNNENVLPVAPHRRRSTTASPLLPRRKHEMVSDESSSESSEIQNSATEISTDSEFAQDEPTPTREIPAIALNDVFVTKTRGSGHVSDLPRRIQVTSSFLQRPLDAAPHPTPTPLKPAPYALNRTQSTGGIAAKVSLELKKRYLLGESGTNSIQKSGSASALDSKFKNFQNTISNCQRMLKPAVEPSASMQMFCTKLDERLSPSGTTPPLPPPDITITTITEQSPGDGESDKQRESFNRETYTCRPVVVEPLQSSDSLSASSSDEAPTSPNFRFDSIPRVEIHAVKDSNREDIALDSLSQVPSEQPKNVAGERKVLNQPKSLPNLEHVLPDIHRALHVRVRSDKEDSPDENKSGKTTLSGKSSPDATAALTETELSDWARDENVSDSIEFDFSQDLEKKRVVNIAKLSEFDEAINEHVCGKDSKEAVNKTILASAVNDLDSIEYMDTGTETSSEDGIGNSQDGYVLFKNEDDVAEDSLNPQINEILEARNIYLRNKETDKRDLYLADSVRDEKHSYEKVEVKSTESKPADNEEDSLVVVETGTTTEENTCSDSTVKNVTEIANDSKESRNKPSLKIENLQKQRLEEKLAKVKAEQALLKEQQLKQSSQKENIENNIQYEEHCQRLQSKVEFGNAKDSIDIRKSRRRSKSDSPQKPDLIREEKERHSPPKDITLNLSPVVRPDILYKKENIKKERDVNQKLVQEMVMNKMKAENKSLERKKRNRANVGSLSPCRPYSVQKSNTTDIVTQINLSNLDKSNKNDSLASSTYATPDLLTNSMTLQHAQTVSAVPDINSSTEKYETPMTSTPAKQHLSRPLSVFSDTHRKPPETPLTTLDNYSMPDIRKQLFSEDFKTPKAPPRYNRPSIIRTAEKLKEDARARARLLSNEDLGLSPDDKLIKLREKIGKKSKENNLITDTHVQESIESLVMNTERRNSLLYSNDTLTKKRNNSFRRSMSGDSEVGSKGLSVSDMRPKSISEIPKNLSVSKSRNIESDSKKACKSDPNLLDTQGPKKKSKDRERRKSITKLIVGIFAKKSPTSNGTKSLFAKLSPKSKAISKETAIEESLKRKCLSENNIERRELTPPPIPPLPEHYIMKATDESSDGENIDWTFAGQGSYDTLDKSINLETSMASLTSRKSLKAKKASRQAQLKRHRMAQEIQRKLEETEVKTRELEQRGVRVEKALRGECTESTSKNESDLLQEWFDLMRDKTELRRYEKELIVRAQELELEDRHARLQAELRERLGNNEHKTDEDVKTEKSIINEMMDIVAQRDSLIAVLEEDRLRYTNEDKGMEEQMLAKGLMMTPIQKSIEK
ncbi:F-actin-monooxygenase Mical-like isoform X2 [Sitophilus oryzae]|uniref:F-actin monooxygenase n=1 Tax=Sitophilus oryzae TaxID=7048 RepID=A0A6J2XS91_SITOR|nr:F-actin-monooxygenase Mical-like isoform X2 [Sitophilus oryzae]